MIPIIPRSNEAESIQAVANKLLFKGDRSSINSLTTILAYRRFWGDCREARLGPSS